MLLARFTLRLLKKRPYSVLMELVNGLPRRYGKGRGLP